ncbi:MAG: hypothetical protein ABSE48_08085 [Verrucomicrobiota bacterium]|jgi:hypothetical protein
MVPLDSTVWIGSLRRAGSLEVNVSLESLLEEYEAAWYGPVKMDILGGARLPDRKISEEQFVVEQICATGAGIGLYHAAYSGRYNPD